MADYHAWGLWPPGFHLTSIVLHGAVAVLLYRLVVALFGDWRAALPAALLFAVHPLHSEAVTYISGRTVRWPRCSCWPRCSGCSRLVVRFSRPVRSAWRFCRANRPRYWSSSFQSCSSRRRPKRGGEAYERGTSSCRAFRSCWSWRCMSPRGIWPSSGRSTRGGRAFPCHAAVHVAPGGAHLPRAPRCSDSSPHGAIAPAASVADPGAWGAVGCSSYSRRAARRWRNRSGPSRSGSCGSRWRSYRWRTSCRSPHSSPSTGCTCRPWDFFVAVGWGLRRLEARGRAKPAMLLLALLLVVYGVRTVRRNADWRDERTLLESTVRFRARQRSGARKSGPGLFRVRRSGASEDRATASGRARARPGALLRRVQPVGSHRAARRAL